MILCKYNYDEYELLWLPTYFRFIFLSPSSHNKRRSRYDAEQAARDHGDGALDDSGRMSGMSRNGIPSAASKHHADENIYGFVPPNNGSQWVVFLFFFGAMKEL